LDSVTPAEQASQKLIEYARASSRRTAGTLKSTTGHYLPLETVNLAGVSIIGVYVIWHEGHPGQVVRIGQGNVAERLGQHRRDPAILAYARRGTLRVIWAAVPAHQIGPVERYLANQWPPLIGDAFPDVAPLAVNSPFAA
jgi:hypothetical protein